MTGPSPSSQTHWNRSKMLQPALDTLSLSPSRHIATQCPRPSKVFSFHRRGSVPERRERHVVSRFANGGNAHYFQLLSFHLELAALRRLLNKRVRLECSLCHVGEVRALRRAIRLMILPNDSGNNEREGGGRIAKQTYGKRLAAKCGVAQAALI